MILDLKGDRYHKGILLALNMLKIIRNVAFAHCHFYRQIKFKSFAFIRSFHYDLTDFNYSILSVKPIFVKPVFVRPRFSNANAILILILISNEQMLFT